MEGNGLGMRLFLETRARQRHDYIFIGAAPSRWWVRFLQATSFEEKSLVLEAVPAEGWRLYATGFPTKRKDWKGTPIRISLGAEGTASDAAEVTKLAAAWLDGAVHGEHLMPDIDASELTNERWMLAPSSEAVTTEVEKYVQSAVLLLSARGEQYEQKDLEGSWVGSAKSEVCRKAFIARLRSLCESRKHGIAVYLNLLETIEDTEELMANEPNDCAVLLESTAEPRLKKPVALKKKQKFPTKNLTLNRALVRIFSLLVIIVVLIGILPRMLMNIYIETILKDLAVRF